MSHIRSTTPSGSPGHLQVVAGQLHSLDNALRSDYDQLQRALEDSDDAFLRRQLVRAGFAWIEGVVFGLKQLALELYSQGFATMPDGYLPFLTEEEFTLSDVGKVGSKPRWHPLLANLRFAFLAATHAYGAIFILEVENGGWSSFKAAVKVRDRLTHPKTVESLDLTEPELKDVYDGVEWFRTQYKNLHLAFADAFTKRPTSA